MRTSGRTWLRRGLYALAGLCAGGAALMLTETWARRGDPAPLPANARADRIEVDKTARTLTLFDGATPLKTYSVALGSGGPGAKRVEGDKLTPEGDYKISGRNPRSGYHLSIRVSYPDSNDVAAAKALGRPAGGDIMIHGLRNGLGAIGALHRALNWTDGCIAVTDEEMDELWRAVPNGAAISIRP